MKKCPECGNPSYDGAPVCGNCGYTFPKPKNAIRSEDIFQKEPKEKKTSNEDSTLNIIKQNKLIIGAILIITLIVICGIVLTGSNDNNSTSPIQTANLAEFSAGNFSFKYPGSWNEVNLTDEEHQGAIFFDAGNDVIVEYYNVSNDSPSVKEITQNRISNAQENGAYTEFVETITLDGRNASNVILENADGDYTRYVSMLSDGELHVFKITGDSFNSVTSEDIDSVIHSADIA